jgi:hypothetical protein
MVAVLVEGSDVLFLGEAESYAFNFELFTHGRRLKALCVTREATYFLLEALNFRERVWHWSDFEILLKNFRFVLQ